ncbi:Helicase associated domain protein [Streptomyces qinglanensis]|uniref:helicase associated domain-containing protein n=1 Tax=Streptomyces qinglanensis TaxID=943816 RepID=UPI003D739B9B
MARELRAHQVEAVDAVVRALDTPAGGIPANGLRASVVMACGTGKTLVAAHSALRLAKGGRVLVLLPTLDLLTQTVEEWRQEGHDGPKVAVCSLDDHPGLWAAGVRTTTNSMRLAMWHKSGPVTVFATYASLPVLAAALEGSYGQQLAPFDLAVVDEAHRTSGSMGKAWAAVHDQQEIPAARRLYLTATPRIWQPRPAVFESREGARDALPEEMACSMDDPAVFGPVVYELGLADAVSMGLLARYQILVVEIRDPELSPERLAGDDRNEEEVRGLRLGALQGALLRTAAEHDLRKVITFHYRTVEAEAYSAGLPGMARRMHRDDPERYPEEVWSGWLRGEHEAEHRAGVLNDFGATAHRAFLSNCKVLGEGVDCPAVDSVALLDPKGSPVDIVQAIGRALRQQPGDGKLASLIVPVFLDEDEQPEDMATSGSYRPLVKVLSGLRAHDERAVELLAIPQEGRGDSVTRTIGPEPEEGEEEGRMLLRFSSPRNPSSVAEWVSLQVIDTERADWARGYLAAKAWRRREGHLRVPLGAVEETGNYPLGRWMRRQRAAFASGQMSSRRAARLEALGMVWEPTEAEWLDNLAAARAWAEERGTLCAPRGAVALERNVGKWLSNQRRKGALEGRPDRAEALAAIDPDWNPAGWSVDWQRRLAGLRLLVEAGGALEEVLPGVTVGGEDIGRWLQQQREGWHTLAEGQQERLSVLGVTAAAPVPAQPGAEAVTGRGGRAAVWERSLEAARQFREREGHLRPARSHVETVTVEGQEHGVKLGVWLSNQRSRRGGLAPERRAALEALEAF